MPYLIVVSLIWAFSFPLFKEYLVFADAARTTLLDSNFTAFARMLLALPVFVFFLKKTHLKGGLAERLMLIGAVQYGVMYCTLNYSYQFLQAHQVALFTIFTPIYVTLINDVYERRFQVMYIGLAMLAVIGAAIIKYDGNDFSNILKGFMLMQVSNACFAFGQIEYRRVRRERTDLRDREVYAMLFFGALIVTALATTASGGWSSAGMLDSTQWLVLVYFGMLASGLGFFFWNKGATLVNPGTLAIFNNLKIPLAVIAALVLRPEEQGDYARLIAGTAIMMLAIVMAERHGAHVLRSKV